MALAVVPGGKGLEIFQPINETNDTNVDFDKWGDYLSDGPIA